MHFSLFTVAAVLSAITVVNALGINCRGSPASAGACELNDLIAAATGIDPNKVILFYESSENMLYFDFDSLFKVEMGDGVLCRGEKLPGHRSLSWHTKIIARFP